MEQKRHLFIGGLILAVCLSLGIGYYFGHRTPAPASDTATDKLEYLQTMNRASIENMVLEDGPIYVIGHRNPDSDTVCSAIAYARLLNQLGYTAEPVITESVNRETAFILNEAGIETPKVLDDASGLNIFLVDHNEYVQAAPGMEDAHIVGVLEHHGLGSVTTGHPVVVEARPIGATATIVWLAYMNYGIEIDSKTAAILMGAILSDTSHFLASTTTAADHEAVRTLAEIAGIDDVDAFYQALHKEALSYEGMGDEEILFSDYKEYETGGTKFGIGLVSAMDEDTAAKLAVRMKNIMPEAVKTTDAVLLYAAMTIRENGTKIDYIVPADELSEQVLTDAFPDYDEYNGTAYIFRSGLGRKTKMVPGLTEYLNAHPHE